MCLCEQDAGSVPNKSILLYLPYNLAPCVCTCECTDHRALGPMGCLTLHPWPPSAGQTLTLEQMDNGLYALSAPDHTLLLPDISAAFPFTSCCPPFLFLHLLPPALDWLNSPKHSDFTFSVIFFSLSIIPFPLELFPYCSPIFHHITHFGFIPLSFYIHPHAGAPRLQLVYPLYFLRL